VEEGDFLVIPDDGFYPVNVTIHCPSSSTSLELMNYINSVDPYNIAAVLTDDSDGSGVFGTLERVLFSDKYYSIDVAKNGDFEILGSPLFENWNTTDGERVAAVESTIVNGGNHAVKLSGYNVPSLPRSIYQDIATNPNNIMMLSVYTRGSGTYSGVYQIIDISNSADIIEPTLLGVTTTSYTRKVVPFRVPHGCSVIEIVFKSNPHLGHDTYIDDVELFVQLSERTRNGYYVTDAAISDQFSLKYKMGGTISNVKYPTKYKSGSFSAIQSLIFPEDVSIDSRYGLGG
jgi:hypothetical protein